MSRSPQSQTEHESKALLVGAILILLVAGYFVSRLFWGESKRVAETAETSLRAETPEEDVSFIEPKTLFQKLQNGDPVAIVDIRTREAYDTEHLPGSLWFNPSALAGFTTDAETAVVIVFSANDPGSMALVENTFEGRPFSFSFLRGGLEGWKFEGFQTISAGDPNSFVDQSKVTYISPEELKSLLQSGAPNIVLLDVQSESNFRQVHLAGAINIPLADLEKRKEEIPVAKEIIVYGENELASFQGGVRLSDLHFFAVRTLTGNDHLSDASPLYREP